MLPYTPRVWCPKMRVNLFKKAYWIILDSQPIYSKLNNAALWLFLKLYNVQLVSGKCHFDNCILVDLTCR